MLGSVNKIEIKGNDKRIYEFYYRPGAPLGEVYDALQQMQRYVIQEMRLEEERRKNDSKT